MIYVRKSGIFECWRLGAELSNIPNFFAHWFNVVEWSLDSCLRRAINSLSPCHKYVIHWLDCYSVYSATLEYYMVEVTNVTVLLYIIIITIVADYLIWWDYRLNAGGIFNTNSFHLATIFLSLNIFNTNIIVFFCIYTLLTNRASEYFDIFVNAVWSRGIFLRF